MLLPQRKTIKQEEGQSRGICIQSVLAKWCCRWLTILMDMELRNVDKINDEIQRIHTLGYKEGRNATNSSSAIRLLATAGHEWEIDLVLYVASLDVRQACDKVTPATLSRTLWASGSMEGARKRCQAKRGSKQRARRKNHTFPFC